MTYHAADGYVLLFGGANLSASLGDTWKFSAGSWTQLSPSTSPNPRGDAAMVYDAADHEVVFFGGTNSTKTFTDTWAFSGGF